MKELQPPHDLIESLGESYELLLESALKKAHQSGAAIHWMIEAVRNDFTASNKFGEDEAAKLEKSIKRDLIDAARYLDKTGNALEGWLGFDAAMIKHEFWKRFSEAADQTTIELNQLKQQAADAGYHSGELVGLGTLVCDQCGEKLHFYKPDYISACPKCNSTHFHRQNLE